MDDAHVSATKILRVSKSSPSLFSPSTSPSIKDIGGTSKGTPESAVVHPLHDDDTSEEVGGSCCPTIYWRLNAMSTTPRARMLTVVEDAPLVDVLSVTVGAATAETVGTETLEREVTVD
jgi:hypothetical protein